MQAWLPSAADWLSRQSGPALATEGDRKQILELHIRMELVCAKWAVPNDMLPEVMNQML